MDLPFNERCASARAFFFSSSLDFLVLRLFFNCLHLKLNLIKMSFCSLFGLCNCQCSGAECSLRFSTLCFDLGWFVVAMAMRMLSKDDYGIDRINIGLRS